MPWCGCSARCRSTMPRRSELTAPQRRDAVLALLRKEEPAAQLARRLGVSEPTLHRWRNQYGGLKQDEAKHLKELEAENARLKRLVAELALDKQMLQEVVQKKF